MMMRKNERAAHDMGEKSDVEQAIDDVRRTAQEAQEEKEWKERLEAAKAREAAERAAAEHGARAELEAHGSAPTAPASGYRNDLYGDFASERGADGKIRLEGDAAKAASAFAGEFRREAKYMTNTFTGERIAAEYDIRTNNFSTQTRIAELPDGRKVFMVYDHRGSWLHRGLDGFMKRRNGLKMRKVSREEWKAQFESKSTIPVIENDDPDTVMMPFQPNVNAHDLFAKNAGVEDFGECGWAKEAGIEEKNEMLGLLVDEVKRIHGTGTAWGELILPNVIYSKDKKPIVCDPEVRYDEDVPLPEAKARDLRDLCLSVAGALEQAHGQNVATTVRGILDRYGDAEVIAELKKAAAERRGFISNLFFAYEKERTGVKGKKQYDAILKAIASYEAPEKAP